MLGEGLDLNLSWLLPEEQQDFLYYSSKVHQQSLLILAGLVVVLALAVLSRVRVLRTLRVARSSASISRPEIMQLRICSWKVLWITFGHSILCLLALPAYLAGAKYYTCGQPLSKATAAYLHSSPVSEVFVAFLWFLSSLLYAQAVATMPPGPRPSRHVSFLVTIVAWLLWIAVVTMLALPSVLYMMAQALPQHNTLHLNADFLRAIHSLAPFIIVLLDKALAVPLSTIFAQKTGIQVDRLLMAFRLGSFWLLPVLTTIFLHENCAGLWKHFWRVCDTRDPEHQLFNWGFYAETILRTDEICQRRASWWAEGRCSRSIIEGMTPFLLKKLLIRICLEPPLLVLLWRFCVIKVEDRPSLVPRKTLRFLCDKGPVTCDSLCLNQQHAFLTTLLELSIFWAPMVPLVAVLVLAAAVANFLLFHWGLGYGALPRMVESNGPSLSKSYLCIALLASVVFQSWYALETMMCGRYMLAVGMIVVVTFSFLKPLRVTRSFWEWCGLPSEADDSHTQDSTELAEFHSAPTR